MFVPDSLEPLMPLGEGPRRIATIVFLIETRAVFQEQPDSLCERLLLGWPKLGACVPAGCSLGRRRQDGIVKRGPPPFVIDCDGRLALVQESPNGIGVGELRGIVQGGSTSIVFQVDGKAFLEEKVGETHGQLVGLAPAAPGDEGPFHCVHDRSVVYVARAFESAEAVC